MQLSKIKSFTLIELLIVIAILAILAAAVVIVLNPGEMLSEARDAERVTSLDSLRKSIDLFVLDNPGSSLGSLNTVYISIPDASSSACANVSGLPTLPSGWTYHCVTASNLRNADSTGWLPLNFSLIKGGSPLPYLPIDPINSASEGKYYTYVMGGSYELTALLEAEKHDAAVKDGGSLTGVYQTGTHIDLTPALRDNGLVGYWTFDEGIGTTAYDSSGKGNNGTWNGASAHYATGKVGAYASSFDGTNNYANCVASASLDLKDSFSASFWVKGPGTNNNYAELFNKYNGSAGWIIQIGGTGPTLYARIDTSAGTNQTNGSLVAFDDTWHHVTYVINKGIKRYYLDGVLKFSGTYNVGGGFSAPTQRLQIGSGLIGQIDDIRLYNRPLSDEEAKIIYDTTK